MVYLLKLVIFHGYVSHNQMVYERWDAPWIELRQAPGFWLGKSWGAVVEAAGRLEVS